MSPESLQLLQYLEHLIGRGEFTLAQIAQELDCSERTVRRLIRLLRAVGGDYVVAKTVWRGAGTEYIWRCERVVFRALESDRVRKG